MEKEEGSNGGASSEAWALGTYYMGTEKMLLFPCPKCYQLESGWSRIRWFLCHVIRESGDEDTVCRRFSYEPRTPGLLKPWPSFVSCKGDGWLKPSSVNSECKIIGGFKDHVFSLCMCAHARFLRICPRPTLKIPLGKSTQNGLARGHLLARECPSFITSLKCLCVHAGEMHGSLPSQRSSHSQLNCPDKNRWKGIILLVRSDIPFLETFTTLEVEFCPLHCCGAA